MTDTVSASVLPLVLLPGTLCDERLFAPMLARLGSPTSLFFAIDAFVSTRAAAEALLAWAPPRFALLGFSLGGIVALEVASLAPERIAGLALIGSNARAVPAPARIARRASLPAANVGMGRYVATILWPGYVAARSVDDDALRDLVADMAEGLGLEVLVRQTEVALTRADSLARLHGLAMPTLVLAGADDALAPPELQREMADALPDATLIILANAGHFAILEAPEDTARAVAGWLDRVTTATQRSLNPPLASTQEIP